MDEHDYEKYPELTNKQLNEIGFTSPHPQIEEDFEAEVVKVHDGDTVTLRTDFRDFDFPLRLSNIDAPEMSEGGQETKEFVEGQVLGEHVTVKINRYNRVGKYGRLLGDLHIGGISVGESELRLGYAQPFGKKNEGEPEDMNKIFRLAKWF